MNTNELKETTIHVMSKVIVNTNPKMVIRRLQDDNAFAIYSNVDATDRIGNTHKHTILIDIVTEKTKPGFFKTIKNIIKVLEKPRRHYFSSLFHSVVIKDNKDNVIEKLIKFDHRTFSFKDYDLDADYYFDYDDEFNIIRMLYNCAEFLIEHKSMFDRFFPASKSAYSYFRYGFVLMDNQAAEDEILAKVITDDLYGYRLTYDNDTNCATFKNKTQTIDFKTECPNELCKCTSEGHCLVDVILYYTADSSLNCNKKVYLQGEFAYMSISFNTSNNDIFERYIIPKTWFDLEYMHVYDAKLDYIACSNCGRDLVINK